MVAGASRSGVVRGILAVCSQGPWPLLLPGDREVLGDILTVQADHRLWSLLGSLEVGWGYSLRWLPTVECPQSRVLACVWEWDELVGPVIPSGNWLECGL